MVFSGLSFCLSLLFIQSTIAQYFPGPLAGDLAYPGSYGSVGCGFPDPIAAACIGPAIAPLASSAVPANLPPPGMSIYSDNLVIEGPVVVAGRMPFTGTVAVEGAFPTCGAGAVTYGCGENGVGIVAEIPVAPVGSPFEYGVIDGYAFNSLTAPNVGCGTRVVY